MDITEFRSAFAAIAKGMAENRDALIALDQKNGDGDLGISMSSGFTAVADTVKKTDERDLGRVMMKAGSAFNEAAPSSLGTILSFGMMGMARALKGKTTCTLAEVADAMQNGLDLIMDKAGSKPGEKTILDALCPAVDVLKANAARDPKTAWALAAEAAAQGSEKTKEMRSVHGRAAYYGDKSIGMLDGGSVVGKILFACVQKAQ